MPMRRSLTAAASLAAAVALTLAGAGSAEAFDSDVTAKQCTDGGGKVVQGYGIYGWDFESLLLCEGGEHHNSKVTG